MGWVQQKMTTVALGPLLARGRTAEVYAWRENTIVKLYYDWCSPHWVQQEIKIGQTIAKLKLPTPSLLDTVEIEGRPGIIYERVTGPSMLKVSNTKPSLLFRLARQFAELHTIIHQQDGSDLSPLLPTLPVAIDWVEALPSAMKTAVQKIVATLPDGHTLCHGDFHPDQLLLTKTGPVIIDWMTAQQGHPLADVAKTAVLLMVGQVPYAGIVMRTFVNLWRGMFSRVYLMHYFSLNPQFSREALYTWMIPIAAVRLTEEIPGEKEPLLNFLASALQPGNSVA